MHWIIENTNLQIIGSIHRSDKPLTLSTQINDAINNASLLAFEANFEFSPHLKLMHYEKNNCLSKNISSSLFASTEKLWRKLELPENDLESHQPWWISCRLMNALLLKNGFIQEHGIDHQILNIAKKAHKKTFFLEKANAGLAPFAQAPLAEQQNFLSKTVLNSEEQMLEVTDIIAAWRSHDLLTLQKIAEKALSHMSVTYSGLLAARNRAWLRHILRFAKSAKNTVVVIGALHMVGNESIPSLLELEGFTCSLVKEHD